MFSDNPNAQTLFVCEKMNSFLEFRCSLDEGICLECISLGEHLLPIDKTTRLKEIFMGAIKARLIPSFSKEVEKTVPADIKKLFVLYSEMCEREDRKNLIISMLNHAARLKDGTETNEVVSKIADMLIDSGEQKLIEEIVAEPRRNNI